MANCALAAAESDQRISHLRHGDQATWYLRRRSRNTTNIHGQRTMLMSGEAQYAEKDTGIP